MGKTAKSFGIVLAGLLLSVGIGFSNQTLAVETDIEGVFPVLPAIKNNLERSKYRVFMPDESLAIKIQMDSDEQIESQLNQILARPEYSFQPTLRRRMLEWQIAICKSDQLAQCSVFPRLKNMLALVTVDQESKDTHNNGYVIEVDFVVDHMTALMGSKNLTWPTLKTQWRQDRQSVYQQMPLFLYSEISGTWYEGAFVYSGLQSYLLSESQVVTKNNIVTLLTYHWKAAQMNGYQDLIQELLPAESPEI